MATFREIIGIWYLASGYESNLGGETTTFDEEFLQMLKGPPMSPMIATLLAPLVLLYNFFELRGRGDGVTSIHYIAKLFQFSSLPREYIALLMAELLPIFIGAKSPGIPY